MLLENLCYFYLPTFFSYMHGTEAVCILNTFQFGIYLYYCKNSDAFIDKWIVFLKNYIKKFY